MGGVANLLAILGDRVVILGLLFTAVLLTVLGVSWLIRPPSAVERRLAAGGALEAQGGPVDVVIRPRQQSRLASLLDRWLVPGHGKLGQQLRDRLAARKRSVTGTCVGSRLRLVCPRQFLEYCRCSSTISTISRHCWALLRVAAPGSCFRQCGWIAGFVRARKQSGWPSRTHST